MAIVASKVLVANHLSKVFLCESNNNSLGSIGWRALLQLFKKAAHRNNKTHSFDALKEVSFSVNKGHSLGIIGLNGSGKSTLLQIISGTLQPSSGNFHVDGNIVALLELGSGFNPEFTGIENIKISASLYGLGYKELKKKINSIIEFANIGSFIDQPVRTYSSGMALRLAFSVAAHVNADLLIIDEALAVGDARFQLKCFTFLEQFKKSGGSIILVSHDLNSIARLCEKSLLLHRGNLLCYDRTINVINEYSKILSKDEGFSIINNQKSETEYKSNSTIELKSIGGELGRISNVLINNKKTDIIKAGDDFVISFNIICLHKIDNPIFAIRIRDTSGQEIYGTNTKFLNHKTHSLNTNDQKIVYFEQKANLGAGKYFISIGFTYYQNEELKIVHRLRECLEFEVINQNASFGLCDCFSQVVIKPI